MLKNSSQVFWRSLSKSPSGRGSCCGSSLIRPIRNLLLDDPHSLQLYILWVKIFCEVHILQGMWHCSDSAKVSSIRKLSSQHSIATNISSMLEVRCAKHQEEWWRNTSALDPPYPAAIPPRGQEAGQEGAKSGWRLPGRSFSSLPLTGTSLTEHQLPKPRRTSGKLLKGKDRSEDKRQIKWQKTLHNHQMSTHMCATK